MNGLLYEFSLDDMWVAMFGDTPNPLRLEGDLTVPISACGYMAADAAVNRGLLTPDPSRLPFADYDDVQLRTFLRECKGDPEWEAAQSEWEKRTGGRYDPFPGVREMFA